METKLKLFGHPVHPMLIVFPLGLLATSFIFDLIYLITDNADLAIFSFWAIAAGVIGGLLAAPFGLVDWLALPGGTRAKSVGLAHGVGNVVVVVLFAISWFLRLDAAAYQPESILPFVLSLIGVLIALVTAWLGGELVYRLRVGVDDDAELNARSSLVEDGAARVDRPV